MANSTQSSARKSQGTKTQVKKETNYEWEFLSSLDKKNKLGLDGFFLKTKESSNSPYYRAYVSFVVESDNRCCGHKMVSRFAQFGGLAKGACNSETAFEEAWELLVDRLISHQFMYSGNISTAQAAAFPGLLKALKKKGATFVYYNNIVHNGAECIFFYLPNLIKEKTKAKNDASRQ